MSAVLRDKRIVSRSDILVLRRPHHRRQPFIDVRVTVEYGSLTLQSLHRRCFLSKLKVDSTHDLKVVWVNDLLDDEEGHIKNSFVVVTPEVNYILQATSHRGKIEWMQTLSIAISQSLRFRGSYRPSSWMNLEDLDKWLAVREVEYTFRQLEVYRGATYTGKWNMGMPHIIGSMKWPTGDRYDGEFVYGRFQGSGTMLWLSDRHKRSYTGQWQDGMMEGFGEMMYADHSVYTGWWHMGKRHQHGTMEYKNINCIYVGGWMADKRTGYGVYDNTVKSEKYLGMWKNDRYHGAGILVAMNNFYYAGPFTFGETLKRNVGSPRSHVLVQDAKWESLFQCCTAMLEKMVSVCHSNISASTQSLPASDGDSAVAMDFAEIGTSPEMDISCRNCHAHLKDDEECVVCRVEGFKSIDHPLGLLVNTLTKCFVDSYSGLSVHKNLLPHAIGELNSITTRVHQLVRRYCPSVITTDASVYSKPKSQLSLLLKPKHSVKRTSYMEMHANIDSSWLYPIILPSIFPTLFELYKIHHSDNVGKFNQLMETLREKTDEELSKLLDITHLYEEWKAVSEPQLSDSMVEDERSHDTFSSYHESAMQIFSTISEYTTPVNKLLCVEEANGELRRLLALQAQEAEVEVSQEPHEIEIQRTMSFSPDLQEDSIAKGLFSFVIVKSRVKFLYSEIHFIQDFAGTALSTDNNGVLLTQLKDCYYQLHDMI